MSFEFDGDLFTELFHSQGGVVCLFDGAALGVPSHGEHTERWKAPIM